MRKYLTAICAVGLLGAGAAVAVAASPATNKTFAGHGGNYWNQNGAWSRHGSSNFQFTTSGRYYTNVKQYVVYIKSFKSTYSTSCNGSHPVTAHWVKVKNGSFNFSFMSHGAHVRIWGNFSSPTRAKVNYVVNFSGSDTNPAGLNTSCATWVHGTAKAQ